MARVLRKAKKDGDAKEVEARLAKLEPRDYAEYAKTMPPFKPEEYKGRKGKGDPAVLVELFTGAESRRACRWIWPSTRSAAPTSRPR